MRAVPDKITLKDLKELESVYLYQTGVIKRDWLELQKMFPKVILDAGDYSVRTPVTDTIRAKLPKG